LPHNYTLTDVESLLGQVKDSKLSSSATTLKASITQQIQTLREEKPQLAANVCIEPALTANRIEVLPGIFCII
jgi:D-alanine-D-alanine ligase-like ATP-grasp enzyme